MDDLYRKKYLKYKKKYLQLKQLEGAATAEGAKTAKKKKKEVEATFEYMGKKDFKFNLDTLDNRKIFLNTLFVYLVKNKDKENIELNGIDEGKKFKELYRLNLSDSNDPKKKNLF